jgi:hypothetical protein
MVYDSTKTLLCSIIRSLETADEAAWDDLHELGKECVQAGPQSRSQDPPIRGHAQHRRQSGSPRTSRDASPAALASCAEMLVKSERFTI